MYSDGGVAPLRFGDLEAIERLTDLEAIQSEALELQKEVEAYQVPSELLSDRTKGSIERLRLLKQESSIVNSSNEKDKIASIGFKIHVNAINEGFGEEKVEEVEEEIIITDTNDSLSKQNFSIKACYGETKINDDEEKVGDEMLGTCPSESLSQNRVALLRARFGETKTNTEKGPKPLAFKVNPIPVPRKRNAEDSLSSFNNAKESDNVNRFGEEKKEEETFVAPQSKLPAMSSLATKISLGEAKTTNGCYEEKPKLLDSKPKREDRKKNAEDFLSSFNKTKEYDETNPAWNSLQVGIFLNEFKGLHKRKKEVEEKMEARLQEQCKVQKNLKAENDKLKKGERSYLVEIRNLKSSIDKLATESQDRERNLETRLTKQIEERVNHEKHQLKEENEKLTKSTESLLKQERERSKQISDLQIQLEVQASNLDAMTKELHSVQEDHTAKTAKISELHLQLNETKQKLESYQSLEEDLVETKETVRNRDDEIAVLRNQLKELDKEVMKKEINEIKEELLKKYKGLKQNLAEKVSALQERDEEIESLKQQLSEYAAESDNVQDLQRQLEEARNDLKTKESIEEENKVLKKEQGDLIQKMESHFTELMNTVQELKDYAQKLEQERDDAIEKMHKCIEDQGKIDENATYENGGEDWKKLADDRMATIDSLLLKLKKTERKKSSKKKGQKSEKLEKLLPEKKKASASDKKDKKKKKSTKTSSKSSKPSNGVAESNTEKVARTSRARRVDPPSTNTGAWTGALSTKGIFYDVYFEK